MRFTLIFILLLGLDLFQVYTDGAYRSYTKPLIMISLVCYYCWHHLKLDKRPMQPVFLLGLFAALAGDLFLLSDKLFIWGLGSFLIMQIAYIVTFWKDRAFKASGFIYGLVLVSIIAGVGWVLWPELGNLKTPVLIYMAAIGGMSWTAFIRQSSIPGYKLVFAGTLFFIVSDAVLAIHQFDTGLNLGKLTVMATYGTAQYLIVTGMIKAH